MGFGCGKERDHSRALAAPVGDDRDQVLEVHLTVLVGVAFTAITIARILEFEAHVVDEQLLATDAEALDVSHHLDRAFKSRRDGKEVTLMVTEPMAVGQVLPLRGPKSKKWGKLITDPLTSMTLMPPAS